MIGIYHKRDFDGYCSGAIIKYKFPEAKLVGADYGEPLGVDVTGEDVIMSDVSFDMEVMQDIATKSKSFVWIDHHISAIQKYGEYTKNNNLRCDVKLENGRAACELTWEYLFPDIEMPLAIKILGEYDTWRNQDKERWDNIIMPFQYGMRSKYYGADDFPIGLFDINQEPVKAVYEIIQVGKIILDYQKRQNTINCRKSFTAEIGKYRAICLNGSGFSSQTFESVYDEKKHDIMVPFQYDGEKWIVSFYTTKDDVDCSELAKSFGGGGHKQASGAQTDDINKIIKIS